jgi:hypothetical protein
MKKTTAPVPPIEIGMAPGLDGLVPTPKRTPTPTAKPKKIAKAARLKAAAGKKAKATMKARAFKKTIAKTAGAATKKSEVVALLHRAGGATLDEIMMKTGWQKHTIRGFVAILGSKYGMKIKSSRRADGARVYEA